MPYREQVNRYLTQTNTIYNKQFNVLGVSLRFLCFAVASTQKLNAISWSLNEKWAIEEDTWGNQLNQNAMVYENWVNQLKKHAIVY